MSLLHSSFVTFLIFVHWFPAHVAPKMSPFRVSVHSLLLVKIKTPSEGVGVSPVNYSMLSLIYAEEEKMYKTMVIGEEISQPKIISCIYIWAKVVNLT